MPGDIHNRNSSAHSPEPEHSEAWRSEVASRLDRYRAKRRRPNPDLSLRFDFESQRQANRSLVTGTLVVPGAVRKAPESATQVAVKPSPTAAEIAALFADALEDKPIAAPQEAPLPPEFDTRAEPPEVPADLLASTAAATPGKPPRVRKIIEFPRPAAQVYFAANELAEPVVQPPRILEALPLAQEDLPVVPAITLDESELPSADPGPLALELPVRAAAMSRRAAAALIDFGVIAVSLALFGYVAVNISALATLLTPALLHNRAAIIAASASAATFWISYHYLLVVFGGATVGIRAAGLQLRTFVGECPTRKDRKRRLYALIISAIAAGLGFAWAFFDEDTLGWHDRISRTYLVQR